VRSFVAEDFLQYDGHVPAGHLHHPARRDFAGRPDVHGPMQLLLAVMFTLKSAPRNSDGFSPYPLSRVAVALSGCPLALPHTRHHAHRHSHWWRAGRLHDHALDLRLAAAQDHEVFHHHFASRVRVGHYL
jgi:hypothetical protein